MESLIINRLSNAFNLTYDLFSQLDEADLKKKLKNLPSNTIGEQVWCMIGARESYFLAIQLGEWNGFRCSLDDSYDKKLVLEKLESSSTSFIRFLRENKMQHIKESFVFDIFEHEIQHHGQLIRFIYGNKLEFPESWNKRYTV